MLYLRDQRGFEEHDLCCLVQGGGKAGAYLPLSAEHSSAISETNECELVPIFS